VAAPQLSLAAADGATVTLEQLWRDHDATVLVFWSGSCPCVRRYQQRIDALLDHYPEARVRVAAISSNAGESFADVLRVARERGQRVPIFRDHDGSVAQAVEAHSTPTAVVLDGSGRLRFRGWIDNERLPGDAQREPWLEQAIDGVLEQRDFRTRTPVYGCAISRSLWQAPESACCHAPH
jgi:peroxiredoxin